MNEKNKSQNQVPHSPHSSIRNPQLIYDLLVIGGGINGVGIANDAAGRGLQVALCEQHDLASGTSWKSSKLIHGGLRYLEYYEFNLVRKALREREILLRKAPHIIWPLTFVMPNDENLRPTWLIRLGLFLYDHLGKRKLLPKSQHLNLTKDPMGQPLKKDFKNGFSYADCFVEDARLVILNAMQAKQANATILPRTKMINAARYNSHWEITLQNTNTGELQTLKARILVNATGPWVEEVLKKQLKITPIHKIALVKGSHIVIPKFYPGEQAYILQNTDKRIVFVIPFETDYCLIGTTDVPFQGDLEHIEIDEAEIIYLSTVVARYFNHPIKSDEIIWTYAGVRPLLKNHAEQPAAITRDFAFELNTENNLAPLLAIFGGKITTYRELAEEALQLLHPYIPKAGPPWTANSPLPGGDIPDANFPAFLQHFQKEYAWLSKSLTHRYARNYGTNAYVLLQNINTINDLGQHFGAGLYQHEVEYLIANEWAETAEDILWRRTKLGLQFTPSATAKLAAFLKLS